MGPKNVWVQQIVGTKFGVKWSGSRKLKYFFLESTSKVSSKSGQLQMRQYSSVVDNISQCLTILGYIWQ